MRLWHHKAGGSLVMSVVWPVTMELSAELREVAISGTPANAQLREGRE